MLSNSFLSSFLYYRSLQDPVLLAHIDDMIHNFGVEFGVTLYSYDMDIQWVVYRPAVGLD